MTTKKGTKVLTELLNIQGIKVTQMTQVPSMGIILQVESIHKESHCHRCGTKSNRLHQNHRYLVKDLSWGEKLVFLEINRRQFKCKKCGKPCSEKLDFVNNRRTYTNNTPDSFLSSDPKPHSTVNISQYREPRTRILPLVIENCPDY